MSALPSSWRISVVAHPQATLVGTGVALGHGSGVVLGRTRHGFGEGIFEDPSVAQAHAVIEVRADGSVGVHALAGATTQVNGHAVTSHELACDDVIALGDVMLVLHRDEGSSSGALPLSERLPAIATRALQLVQSLLGRAVSLHPDSTIAVVRHDWVDGAQLDAVVGDAVAGYRGTGPLHVPVPSQTPWPVEHCDTAGPEDGLTVGPTWFRRGGAPSVQLGSRRVLSRVYRALYERRVERPGEPVSLQQLLTEGWPGERMIARAGANRVYVALTTLRKLGLRSTIIRTKSGYMLDPQVAIESRAPSSPQSRAA